MIARSNTVIDRLLALAGWLVLPVCLLLFLQWPLRDLLARASREANDLGQVLFALYVAMAVTAATRRRVHLATDAVARRWPPALRAAFLVLGNAFGLLPWGLLILVAGWPVAFHSVAGLEHFPDTGNPLYFVVKAAMLLIGLLAVLQAVADIAGALHGQGSA
jgi:TRAP-type mannitol/chloroaromatic compound transport system permease small subunit